jgi:ribosomal protein S12 methylthiotransferase
VQELVLISQIITNYGLDLYGQPRLADLLRALGGVDIPWIRMHYAYPTGLTGEVLAAMAETPNLLPYLDLPLQHSHPEVLRAMNRPWQGRVNDQVIDQIRQALPNAVLRTTFIVGFPGETKAHFEHLVAFVERHRFDHVGVFGFSAEPGTPAYSLPHPVPPAVIDQRRETLMLVQQPIAWQYHQAQIGQIVDVLIEQENPASGMAIGRSSRFAPDVDGVIYVTGSPPLNQIVPVQITAADTYDLFGQTLPPGRSILS